MAIKKNFSPRYRFSDWPNKAIPLVAIGVYAIWKKEQLIYCGMSGRDYENKIKNKPKKFGLITRLNAHSKGRLSGNQFCVYVANRIIIPSLKPDDLAKFANGTLTLDQFTKQYIHQHFEYQYQILQSSDEAFQLERECKSGKIFGQKPSLNPS